MQTKLLELIASNIPQNIRDCGVISASLSDHELVYCIRNCKLNWIKAAAQIKTFRNYANYNQAKFCAELKEVNLSPVNIPDEEVNERPVDDLWNVFKSAFVSVADCHTLIIQKRVRGMDNCPWLNSDKIGRAHV